MHERFLNSHFLVKREQELTRAVKLYTIQYLGMVLELNFISSLHPVFIGSPRL